MRLTRFRIIFAGLLIVPVAILLYHVFHLDNYWSANSTVGEMLFIIFGIPILFINYCLWLEPQFINEFFQDQAEE